jgi:hypothetical protein
MKSVDEKLIYYEGEGMGAWGVSNFDNDDAQDWLNDFTAKPNITAVKEALLTVINLGPDEYLEMPDCGSALAAAEVVAAMGNMPSAELPTEIIQWSKEHSSLVSDSITSLALEALLRIKTNSEMQEAWQEAISEPQWQAEIKALEVRLGHTSA